MVRPPTARNSGFTLIEIMVIAALTAVVAVGIYQVLFAGRRSHDATQNHLEMQQNARVAISSLAEDFRHVSYGKDPTQPSILSAGPASIVFVADLDREVPGAEVISYFLDPDGDPDTPNPNDTILMKTVTDSAGNLLSSSPQSYGITRGGLRLGYFNGGGAPLPNPVPSPELIGEMSIEVTVTEPRQWRQEPYGTMTLSATIYPRNLPLSPARSRPSTPVCLPPTYPNCSAVTLQWAIPTTNTDGTPLAPIDISHFGIYLGTDPENLPLQARTPRNATSWTIGSLGCENYTIAVTCVSRSGVESYKCMQPVSVLGGSPPRAPATLTAVDSSGVKLRWSAVTQLQDGQAITVPVTYLIHRSTDAGFTPGAGNRIGSVTGQRWFIDPVSNDCAVYYYNVMASVCCQEGPSSPEAMAIRPPPPQCPPQVVATSGTIPGEMIVSWTHPGMRSDLTPLPLDEIAGTWVFYDTTPGGSAASSYVAGTGNQVTISNLSPCTTYYVRAKTVDTCGNQSAGSCIGSQASVTLAGFCDPSLPPMPAALTAVAGDRRLDLTWPHTTLCDLYGYRIHYGIASGVYTGTGATEGPSPIEVHRSQVAAGGGNAQYSLTGLESCQNYFVAVQAVDLCAPRNASALSPQASGLTACSPCQIAAACPTWGSTSPSEHRDLRLEIRGSGSDETLARLRPSWSGPARVVQVLYGRPLLQIWNQNGTAGGDGAVGPRASETTLNVDDVVVPSWTRAADGMPLVLVFDQDVQNLTADLRFINFQGGTCTSTGRSYPLALFANFDSGSLSEWETRSGSWTVSEGELLQSPGSGNRLLIGNASFGNITYEAKIQVVSGTAAFLAFRYSDDNNYGLVGINPSSGRVIFGKVRNGNYSEKATANASLQTGRWYNLRVVVANKTCTVFLDCVQVIQSTDNQLNATGKIGFRTTSAVARYDDVRCQSVAQLP